METNTINTVITSIISNLGAIEFAGSTLSSLSLIKAYQAADITNANTQVNVYAGNLASIMIENRKQRETFEVVIDVMALFVDRQAEAQNNLNYLSIEIMRKLNDTWNSDYSGSWLDASNISFSAPRVLGNYYIRSLRIPVKGYYTF